MGAQLAQVFTASADARFRAVIILACVAACLTFFLASGFAQSQYETLVGWVRGQPIPFSHLHHAGDLGIDCRYCHTSVETSARAGLPATHICMTCHSQLWTGAPMLALLRKSLATGEPIKWQRVSSVPDYVYFNHSIHVNRGVPCETCHGRVDKMPLMTRGQPFEMKFCLECHRNPAPSLRPPSEVTRMDWSKWDPTSPEHKLYGRLMAAAYHLDPKKMTDCSTCHR